MMSSILWWLILPYGSGVIVLSVAAKRYLESSDIQRSLSHRVWLGIFIFLLIMTWPIAGAVGLALMAIGMVLSS